ncbi:hypothetical protein F1C16_20000 (plasmid) [Hymenobacter sp. NBH84]|uniref:hypothetical protein n=1 Tax=Hymenobacter sp. NBH84 TaxID=2596915 RepID=UPI0016295443|nr:hypothetical protein [Hymenobacter sp. NBH84]QNE41917.1 hypothetical protein F1C16_20000 [Hymenobacter sp. NBH84]
MDAFEFYLTRLFVGAPIQHNHKIIIMLQLIFANKSNPIASSFIQLIQRFAPDSIDRTSVESADFQDGAFLQFFSPRILLVDVDDIVQ